jgi:hypothetical protein
MYHSGYLCLVLYKYVVYFTSDSLSSTKAARMVHICQWREAIGGKICNIFIQYKTKAARMVHMSNMLYIFPLIASLHWHICTILAAFVLYCTNMLYILPLIASSLTCTILAAFVLYQWREAIRGQICNIFIQYKTKAARMVHICQWREAIGGKICNIFIQYKTKAARMSGYLCLVLYKNVVYFTSDSLSSLTYVPFWLPLSCIV